MFDKKLTIHKIITSILVGAFFVFTQTVIAQEDSAKTAIDSTESIVYIGDNGENITGDTSLVLKEREHSPKIAVISSAIIPGLGQAYNKKYWKIPIIYGTGTLLYYYYDIYNDYYIRLQKSYDEVSNDLPISDPQFTGQSITSIEAKRNDVRRNRDYQIIFMGLLYVANIVDAMVDAHLYKYDISRDLTMQIGPTIIPPNPASYNASCGIKVKFSF